MHFSVLPCQQCLGHSSTNWGLPILLGGPPPIYVYGPSMYRSTIPVCSTLVEATLRTAWIKQGDTVGVEKVFPIRATGNFLQKISLGTYSNLVNLPGSRSYHAEISLDLDQFKINMTGWIWILIKGNGSSITGIEKNII